MAFKYIPKQPILFRDIGFVEDPFESRYSNYKSSYLGSDLIPFQFEVTYFDGVVLVSDPGFVVGTPWTFAGAASHNAGNQTGAFNANDDTASISQAISGAQPEQYFLVLFHVKNWVSGTMTVEIGDKVCVIGNVDDPENLDGIFTILIWPQDIGDGKIYFRSGPNGLEAEIDLVQPVRLSDPEIKFKNVNTGVEVLVPRDDLTSYSNWETELIEFPNEGCLLKGWVTFWIAPNTYGNYVSGNCFTIIAQSDGRAADIYESEELILVDAFRFELIKAQWRNDEPFILNDSQALRYDIHNPNTGLTEFNLMMYISGKIMNPKYESDRTLVPLNRQHALLVSASGKKVFEFKVYYMPEHKHDAHAIALMHDNYNLGSKRYVQNGEDYSPEWEDSWREAPVIVELILFDEFNRNLNC